MARRGSRLPLLIGLTVAGAGGYYLYVSGGDPKVAQKKIERKLLRLNEKNLSRMIRLLTNATDDATSATAKLKGELPGSGKEAQKQGEEYAHRAGAAIDSTVSLGGDPPVLITLIPSFQVGDIRAKLDAADKNIGSKVQEADAKFQQLRADGSKEFDHARKETAKELTETTDKFDKTVQKKTAEAKSGISSWFGFGK